MRLQEIIDTLDEVPYHSRHQVLKELETFELIKKAKSGKGNSNILYIGRV